MEKYFGRYERFNTLSKKDAAQLLTADNLVGDVYDIEIDLDGDVHQAWMVSRFGKRVAYFEPAFSRKLSVMKAQGMDLRAVLAFVAYTDHPGEGMYWGNAAVICYNPAYSDVFDRFISGVAQKIGEGFMPKIDLNNEGVEQIISSDGAWVPNQRVDYPGKKKGTAIVKKSRSITDKMVEMGRAGNKGCYVGSWVFLLLLVSLVVFAIVRCTA